MEFLPGTPGFSRSPNRAAPIESNQFDARIDHNLTANQSIFGRYTWKNIDQTAPSSLKLRARTVFEKNRNLVISHNYTITPSVLNEFRFGRTYRDTGAAFYYGRHYEFAGC